MVYQTGVQAYSPYTRLSQIAYDGDTYGVYATNNLNVGYIARWRYSIAGQPTEWTPLTDAAGVYKTPLLVSLSHGAATAYDVGIETQIKLVRRNEDTIPSGNSLFAFDPLYARPMQTSAGATFYSANYRVTQVRAATVIVLKGGTCTTPDVTVNLPDVRASQFSGVGRTAARKDFELKFENCPLGFGGINYSFSPTTSVLDAANGVVALSGASTASGVGVQFMHSQNEPLQFGKAYQLGEYSPWWAGATPSRCRRGCTRPAPAWSPERQAVRLPSG
ncbi:fimbrial protein [Diaphorobacter aerolatus]|uniref:Fimbrial protein n=1 Tax=Diaphorobacter aerolatus TaxID=1288495 RepID=A0A7H0GHE1_9BURK|nr:fimbrial protein [Diaphorobacter aerolatus]QNP47707.1 fimbrial protein [Diaphorobacter aerolatus]